MAASHILSLALVAAVSSLASGERQCYNCGHRTLPDGTTEALPGLPECGDFATLEDTTRTCGNGDDCCAIVEAYFTKVDETTGEDSTVIIGRHGCESDLSQIGEVGVYCSEHTDECVNVDHSSLPNINDRNVTITDMEICFCSGDRCNAEDPTIPPEPTNEPTHPTQKGKQCYNCGYRKLPNGETEKLPDLAECSDFATPEDITITCGNGDDCCASEKAYFTTVDETTGENSTVIIGRHGCESDLSHIAEQGVLCSEHTDACINVDRSSLPNENDHNVTITDMEICFCSGDRCNGEDPIPPEPTTSTPTTENPSPTPPLGKCIHRNQLCDIHEDNLISSQNGLTGAECNQLCKDTWQCNVFTYFEQDSYPFQEMCILFNSCDTLGDCQECLTAFMTEQCSCGISYEGSINDNLIYFEADVETEEDCKSLCFSNEACSVYTYYDAAHTTNKKLCMLLTSLHDPVTRCENCQSGPNRCETYDQCRLSVWGDGDEFSANKFLSAESKIVNFISGEDSCYKTINAVAVGSGGSGEHSRCTGGSGGGSGFINSTEFVLRSNQNISVGIEINGEGSSLIMIDTGEIILSAANGLTHDCQDGGDGYSGGGGEANDASANGGDGGTAGGDGEDGNLSTYNGGKGSGLDIESIDMNYHQLSAGKGGENQGYYGGGGGGILVDGLGPDTGYAAGFGEGYGGGAVGGDHIPGMPGLVILEIL